MNRVWKDIKGYNGKYQISNDGLVKSLVGNEKLLRIEENSKGYLRVELCEGKRIRKKHFIHRLVYQAFVGDIPNDKQIDHLDTNRKNNTIENLRLVSAKENNNNPITLRHHSKETIITNDEKIILLDSQKETAKYLGVTKQTVSKAIKCNKRIKGYTVKTKA